MLSIIAVGKWGPVWAIVLVEIFNGPCYGFGYPALVVYAGYVAPQGVITTVQSLANVFYDTLGQRLLH